MLFFLFLKRRFSQINAENNFDYNKKNMSAKICVNLRFSETNLF